MTEVFFDSDYLSRLMREVQKAKRSIDIAMYIWRDYSHNPQEPAQQLFIEILQAKARGVRVRVITDFQSSAEMFSATGVEAISLQAHRYSMQSYLSLTAPLSRSAHITLHTDQQRKIMKYLSLQEK